MPILPINLCWELDQRRWCWILQNKMWTRHWAFERMGWWKRKLTQVRLEMIKPSSADSARAFFKHRLPCTAGTVFTCAYLYLKPKTNWPQRKFSLGSSIQAIVTCTAENPSLVCMSFLCHKLKTHNCWEDLGGHQAIILYLQVILVFRHIGSFPSKKES